jgi:hypothetical protein
MWITYFIYHTLFKRFCTYIYDQNNIVNDQNTKQCNEQNKKNIIKNNNDNDYCATTSDKKIEKNMFSSVSCCNSIIIFQRINFEMKNSKYQ